MLSCNRSLQSSMLNCTLPCLCLSQHILALTYKKSTSLQQWLIEMPQKELDTVHAEIQESKNQCVSMSKQFMESFNEMLVSIDLLHQQILSCCEQTTLLNSLLEGMDMAVPSKQLSSEGFLLISGLPKSPSNNSYIFVSCLGDGSSRSTLMSQASPRFDKQNKCLWNYNISLFLMFVTLGCHYLVVIHANIALSSWMTFFITYCHCSLNTADTHCFHWSFCSSLNSRLGQGS